MTFQDHLYVQYVELTVFQTEYLHVSSRFKDNETFILDIPDSGCNLEEVNIELDKLESLMEVVNRIITDLMDSVSLQLHLSLFTMCMCPKISY